MSSLRKFPQPARQNSALPAPAPPSGFSQRPLTKPPRSIATSVELSFRATPSKQTRARLFNRYNPPALRLGRALFAALFLFAAAFLSPARAQNSPAPARAGQAPSAQNPPSQAPAGQVPSPQSQVDPWTPAQLVQPQDLVKELAGPRKPIVVCVGFHALFEGAHVPGAVFHGSASNSDGLDDLKKWAQSLPRSANLVVYCGCCPMAHCPNIRPGFEALRDMGFTRLRVLQLPDDFATDWVARGYPVEKGK